MKINIDSQRADALTVETWCWSPEFTGILQMLKRSDGFVTQHAETAFNRKIGKGISTSD